MAKYPIYIQDEEMACGAYCILMLLKFYGYNEEVSEVKNKARLNHHGISIKGIVECLKEYQIESKAYEASLDDIKENVKLPCILYTIQNGYGHFIVLYEIKEDEYIIGDPAQGLISIYEEDLLEIYVNKMISIQHVGRVPQLYYKSYYQFLKETFLSYKKPMKQMIYKGFWIAILSYLSSFFYQILIDEIHVNTKFFYMIVLSMTYGMIEIMKVSIDHCKTKQVISLTRAIDEDCVFQSSMNLFALPYSFFYQDNGQIQSQLMSFYQLTELSVECFGTLILDGILMVILLIGMLLIDYMMIMVVLILFAIIIILNYKGLNRLQDMNKEYLEAYYKHSHHLLELIENQFLIKRYSLIQKTRERSYHIFLDEALSKEKQSLYMNQFQHLLQYIIYIFYVIIMIFGFYQMTKKRLSLGQILMFYMLMSYCIDPIMHMMMLVCEYKQSSLIYEKYKSFIPLKENDKEEIRGKICSITFDNVGYSYGYQRPLFEHLDFKIDKHMLVKGETGVGKSTLLRLLMGYDLNYIGDIYVNDQELRHLSLSSLYQHIGYISQTPTFLHMSLFDNFLCHDEEKVKFYLKAFHQEELEKMFPVILDIDGSPLSLGQRQVVSVIRMLCQDFDVCIMDEAFSHMDTKLAGIVSRYLYSHDDGKIYIVVNHQTKIVKKGWDCVIIGNNKGSKG